MIVGGVNVYQAFFVAPGNVSANGIEITSE